MHVAWAVPRMASCQSTVAMFQNTMLLIIAVPNFSKSTCLTLALSWVDQFALTAFLLWCLSRTSYSPHVLIKQQQLATDIVDES